MSKDQKTIFGTFTVTQENLDLFNGVTKAPKIKDIQSAFADSFLRVGHQVGSTSSYTGGFSTEDIKKKDADGKSTATEVQKSTHDMFHSIISYSRVVEEDADQVRIKSAVGIVQSSYGLMSTGNRTDEQSKALKDAVDILHKYNFHASVSWNSTENKQFVEFSTINSRKMTQALRKEYGMPKQDS